MNYSNSAQAPEKENKDNKKSMGLKVGIDSNGLPYFDLSDRETARKFIAQADAFRGIKIT
ncbi:hypothetical protein [Photobacterium sp. GB-72]|uniref:hypothetical protein n=1 Tax=Photobacterium sp. GB-72 TaxID=2022105 RepID=UPI000D178A31|nr:hypothetical protein [Photobacterium sp. GB-72]PSV27642.1 hypothetical protein C9J40_20110 [Photobacterium sp. GB-72]